MKKYFLILTILFASATSGFSQLYAKHKNSAELGVLLGVSYYIGDMNQTVQFLYSNVAGGVLFRYNLNPRITLRMHALFGKIEGHDSHSPNPAQVQRNLNFKSQINEFGGQVEFNFYNYRIGIDKERFSPYIFLGLSAFSFNPKGQSPKGDWVSLQPLHTEGEGLDGGKKKPYPLVQISLPFGVGIKANFLRRFSLGLEWGMRKTFTDYLDDVHGRYYPPGRLGNSTAAYFSDRSINNTPGYSNVGRQRGNATNKDWYSFAGVILTISLKSNKMTCPTVE